MPDAMLSFKIGPVQPFIEAARTLRDLWSGSYLLSWLTAHGMTPLIEKYGYDAFITPHVTADNPLVRAVMSKTPTKDEAATLACLPHTFAAAVNWDDRATLRKAVEDAVRNEWKRIADAVQAELPGVMHSHFANWDKQIDTFFEIIVVIRQDQGTPPNDETWAEKEWGPLAELLEMTRSVRHVPAYSPQGDERGRFPVKCSQLGSFEQMGPAELRDSNEYWEQVVAATRDGFRGTRLQPSDKLCAVSLVKRFAWPVYWSKRLGLPPDLRRLSDTATLAAKKWLADGEPMDPDELRDEHRNWNGQWLHWATDDQGAKDGDPKRPRAVADRVARKVAAQKRPPTYYALMHLDGDSMGELFQGEKGKTFGFGTARFRVITEKLTTFALVDVKRIVEKHSGELIYAGGDDVLAFLPTETVIACARQLREAFSAKDCLPNATLSGGIAVVHYKEDLRFALGQVRAAEKVAKRIVRKGSAKPKDALALTICRRSGEHATVVMGWDQTPLLQSLVGDFKGTHEHPPASDRWTYKLRTVTPTLTALPLAAGRAETTRLVGRVENAPPKFDDRIGTLFGSYQAEVGFADPDLARPDADVLTGFVALCQSASFLARGKE